MRTIQPIDISIDQDELVKALATYLILTLIEEEDDGQDLCGVEDCRVG